MRTLCHNVENILKSAAVFNGALSSHGPCVLSDPAAPTSSSFFKEAWVNFRSTVKFYGLNPSVRPILDLWE